MQREHHEAYTILNEDRIGATPVIVLCDHAANTLPPAYGKLGLPASEFERHIAFDPGAAALTCALARRFEAPAILSRYSRLLIDLNRGLDDPTLIMRLSDGTIIPGNRHLSAAEIGTRIARYYEPYHQAVDSMIDAAIAAGMPPLLLSIHTFTPVWRGMHRPWHAGILWDKDSRLARLFLDGLAREPGLIVGDNAPYNGALQNDCLYRHGTQRGLAHVLLEVRNDLLATPEDATRWSNQIAGILESALAEPAIRSALLSIRHYGSRTD